MGDLVFGVEASIIRVLGLGLRVGIRVPRRVLVTIYNEGFQHKGCYKGS